MSVGETGVAAASAGRASAGIAYLRGRTVARSLRAYVRWVGRAIGWWTVGYLIFWLVVFGISAFEALPRSAQPVPLDPVYYAGALVALWFLSVLLSGRVPPLNLDSRDLYRLALAPVSPHDVLAYRLWLRRGTRALGGAALGAIWALFASALLHRATPWAPLVGALLAVARFDVGWLRYVARTARGSSGSSPRTASLLLTVLGAASAALSSFLYFTGGAAPARDVGAAAVGLTVTSALWSGSWLVLVAPVLLAVAAHVAVRRSLREEWPPRFASQSLVLAQLQGLRSMQFLAALAGFGFSGVAGPGERERLLATLHDRPGSTRPRRSLPRPSADAPAWQGIAWRAATALYRRPVRTWFLLAAQVFAACCGGLVAAGQVVGGAAAVTAAPGAGGLAGSLGGALTVLVAGFLTARATAAFVGPGLPSKLAPVPASARNLGRSVPVLAALALFTPLAWFTTSLLPVAATVSSGLLAAYATILLTGVLAVEKYSSWTGVEPGRMEPQLVAALLVALPALILQALGYPDWVLGSQIALLLVVSLIEV